MRTQASHLDWVIVDGGVFYLLCVLFCFVLFTFSPNIARFILIFDEIHGPSRLF